MIITDGVCGPYRLAHPIPVKRFGPRFLFRCPMQSDGLKRVMRGICVALTPNWLDLKQRSRAGDRDLAVRRNQAQVDEQWTGLEPVRLDEALIADEPLTLQKVHRRAR